MENKQMNLYMWWPFRKNHTIFALAPNLDEAKKIAINKAGGSLKDEVSEFVEKHKPSITDETHSFIYETGAQFIG